MPPWQVEFNKAAQSLSDSHFSPEQKKQAQGRLMKVPGFLPHPSSSEHARRERIDNRRSYIQSGQQLSTVSPGLSCAAASHRLHRFCRTGAEALAPYLRFASFLPLFQSQFGRFV